MSVWFPPERLKAGPAGLAVSIMVILKAAESCCEASSWPPSALYADQKLEWIHMSCPKGRSGRQQERLTNHMASVPIDWCICDLCLVRPVAALSFSLDQVSGSSRTPGSRFVELLRPLPQTDQRYHGSICVRSPSLCRDAETSA